MTDKTLERANEIKSKLISLRQLKQSLKENIRVTVNLDYYNNLRQRFIEVVQEETDKLNAEYESL